METYTSTARNLILAEQKSLDKIQLAVTGTSMVPFLRQADLLTIDIGNNNKDYKIGDILLCKESEDFITHRLIDFVNDGRLILKGDNCVFPDPPALIDQIIGKAIFLQRVNSHKRSICLSSRRNQLIGKLHQTEAKIALKLFGMTKKDNQTDITIFQVIFQKFVFSLFQMLNLVFSIRY